MPDQRQITTISRRRFLRQGLATAAGFAGLSVFSSCRSAAQYVQSVSTKYGFPVKDRLGILNLPEGFSYRIISRAGDRMSDGLVVPGLADGMAAFSGGSNQTILVRNHEINHNAGGNIGPFGNENELVSSDILMAAFDAGFGSPCLGGTTTVVLNSGTLEVEREFLSLVGTVRNCAGGPTPWNSWITCEETDVRKDHRCEKDHGYAFDVRASDDGQLQAARPILPMGRFYREAVAVHPATSIVYQTEDKEDGLFYRYIPSNPDDLHAGGRTQALAIVDRPRTDTRNWNSMDVPREQKMPVEWIDIEDVHNPDNDLRYRGYSAGAARFARAEGIWYANDVIYFACTNGGLQKKGQIWKYYPSFNEGTAQESEAPPAVELFIQADKPSIIENADNLTVAPWGDLIVCEDGPGKQNLVGVTPAGSIYPFAENAVSTSEFAGATFSPDGRVLFVNIQAEGLTFAITGPWV
ncbi:MAG: DUF839 domain-containing protein [Rhodothermales bacterium]|nr:DUF839 domain-containing protein [Rhodothermales bacterium]